MDIYGTAGDDLLERLAPPGIHIWVNLWGGAGNDTIRVNGSTAIGEAGNDTIIGLDNPEFSVALPSAAYWNSPAGVTVDLVAGTVQDGFGTVDMLQNIRSVRDSTHGDHITGSIRDEQFWLGLGNDTVIGGGGHDTVIFDGMYSTEVSTTLDLATGIITVSKHTLQGDHGTTTLSGIASIQFRDNTTAGISSASGGLMVTGGGGSEIVVSGAGDDKINGGAGVDTVAYQGGRAGYVIVRSEAGITVSGAQGNDTLSGIERLEFLDQSVAFDIDGVAGQAYRMYQSVFNRDPDAAGMGFWLKMLDNGVSLTAVAQGFVDSAEFDAVYGANATSNDIVTRLFANVFNGVDTTGGIAFWTSALDTGATTLADLVFGLSESAGSMVDLVGVTATGVTYTPWG